MKKILASMIVTVMITVLLMPMAMASGMGPMSVDTVLSDIRMELGLGVTDTIDPNKVRTEKLVALGDSVMELMIGNNAIHEQMDKNLGGDGSASLDAFHQRLGYNYLSGYPTGMMDLMTAGMMSVNQNGMMGYFRAGSELGNFGWGGLVFLVLFLAALAVIIVLAIRKPRRINTD